MADNNREGSRGQEAEPPLDAQVTSSFPAGSFPAADSPSAADSPPDSAPSPPDRQAPEAEPEPDSKSDADSDADSWVAQWSSLFDDDPAPTSDPDPDTDQATADGDPSIHGTSTQGPSTREMPVFQAEQPPVSEVELPPDVLPGHLGPAAPGRSKPQRDDNSDAAEIAAWQKAQERTKRRAKLRANQRKARVMQRNRPAGGDIRAGDPVNIRPSIGSRPNRRTAIVTGALVLAGAMALFGYLLTGFGQDSNGEGDSNLAGRSVTPAGQDLTVGADLGQTDIQDLALSTVQLAGLNDELTPECAGSGVIVDSDGLILTNAHVVTSVGGCQFTSIGVAVTVDSSSAANLRYRAEVLAVDPTLDLAVVRIADWLDSDEAADLPDSFPAAPLGDSDSVGLGDAVRILGYPVIGGETITLTTGSVSGFTSQAGVGNRALIKTDATISAGNSGGMAVDADGRVIGIPTKAQASETGPAIDCRPVTDTNDDGTVDSEDNCVSVGGFLNGVRPINLAAPILQEAATAEPIGPVVQPTGPQTDLDFDSIVIEHPRFSLGRNGNQPAEIVTTAQAGISDLCFFLDWSGIPVGTRWDGAWFVDGQAEPELSVSNETWDVRPAGTDFWICASEESEVGLPAGVYEVGFFLEGEVLFAEGIVLTEEPVEVVPVTWSNDTGIELCGLAVNPFSDSGQIGLNELDRGETIPPDDSRTIDLPLGRYVVEAYNCDGEAVADNFTGLRVEGPVTFLVGIAPSN